MFDPILQCHPVRQHVSGIHPPGGRVAPSPPVVWPIARPGGIGRTYYVTPQRTTPPSDDITIPPPFELLQRWQAAVAARDDRMPDETDMVAHVYQPTRGESRE